MINITGLRNGLTSLEDYLWPLGTWNATVTSVPIKSLKGLPLSLGRLSLNNCSITSFEGFPLDLRSLSLSHLSQPVDLAPVLAAAYCGALQWFDYPSRHPQMAEDCKELLRAVSVPLNKRPARVVSVVLSASSVPRVGMRAAVRRLHRADLVREMAGMLNEVYEPPEDDEDEDSEEEEDEEDEDEE